MALRTYCEATRPNSQPHRSDESAQRTPASMHLFYTRQELLAARRLALTFPRQLTPSTASSIVTSARAVSSAGEHSLHTRGVTGSNPVPPTSQGRKTRVQSEPGLPIYTRIYTMTAQVTARPLLAAQ